MIRDILLAQWRISWHHRPASGRPARALTAALWILWYSIWAVVGIFAAMLCASAPRSALATGVPWALLGITVYWQVTPVLTANLGAGLDLKKLLIYPIPDSKLFLIDLVLRANTGLEMLLVLAGVTIGLMQNAAVPGWAPLAGAAMLVAFNLMVSVGLHSAIERLMGIGRLRELIAFAFILCAALPQLILVAGVPRGLRRVAFNFPLPFLPWTAAARLQLGEGAISAAGVLLSWTAAAYVFARRQFRRSLVIDAAAPKIPVLRISRERRWPEALYRMPSLFLPDPLGALLEKELRTLARSPRFRILFLMGFTFGMIIWLPVASQGGRVSDDYPLFVSFYAAVLMAEVVIWNQFGFDRAATELYFSVPVSIRDVLRAKNAASVLAIMAEITIVLAVCAVLRVHLSGAKVIEAYAVTLVGCLYFLAAGNLSSLYQPRPIDPEHAWGRGSGSRFQWQLLLLFPLLISPLSLAYLARYAFASGLAFYLVLGFDALAGVAVYHVAMDSAVRASETRKEDFLVRIAGSSGPIAVD